MHIFKIKSDFQPNEKKSIKRILNMQQLLIKAKLVSFKERLYGSLYSVSANFQSTSLAFYRGKTEIGIYKLPNLNFTNETVGTCLD